MKKNENLFHVAFRLFKMDNAQSTYLYGRVETLVKKIFGEEYENVDIDTVKQKIEEMSKREITEIRSGKNSYTLLEEFFEEYLE